MTILWIVLAVLAFYLFAIMPRMWKKPDYSRLDGWYYAHRGLHDNKSEAPENSMAAFKKAVDKGFGIELDVQLTKDRIPVVFHDETLKRICNVPGKVRDYTYEELKQFQICETEERIPLFADFLQLIDGKVPLVIEIKCYENALRVCRIADELIKAYKGVYCVESFHPLAVNWYKRKRPEVIRGQLSGNLAKPGKRENPIYVMAHYLIFNIIGRPDFIAYNHKNKNNISRILCTKLYGALSVGWTIRSHEELKRCKKDFKLFIFEGFLP